MVRWLTVAAIVLGLGCSVAIGVCTWFINDRSQAHRLKRLRVYLVPPPAPPTPSNNTKTKQWAAGEPGGGGAERGKAGEGGSLAALFPVYSSSQELFQLLAYSDPPQPHASLLLALNRDIEGDGVNLPTNLGASEDYPEGENPQHVVRGDRRLQAAYDSDPDQTLAAPRNFGTFASKPIPVDAHRSQASAPPTPADRNKDIDDCVRLGGAPVFVQGPVSARQVEEAVNEDVHGNAAQSEAVRKALRALMQVYERHMQLQATARPESQSKLVNNCVTRPTRPPSKAPEPPTALITTQLKSNVTLSAKASSTPAFTFATKLYSQSKSILNTKSITHTNATSTPKLASTTMSTSTLQTVRTAVDVGDLKKIFGEDTTDAPTAGPATSVSKVSRSTTPPRSQDEDFNLKNIFGEVDAVATEPTKQKIAVRLSEQVDFPSDYDDYNMHFQRVLRPLRRASA